MRGSLNKFFAGFSLVPALALCLAMMLGLTPLGSSVAANRSQDLTIQADFDGKTISPDDAIELTLSRLPLPSEGRIAVVVGQTDLSDLFLAEGNSLKHAPKPFPLPEGETTLTVYLVTPSGDWKEIASFKLKVASKPEPVAPVVAETAPAANAEQATATQTADASQAAAQAQTPVEPVKRRFGFDKFEMLPSLNIGFKSQFAETHFPDSNKPERPTFADATLQGTWKSEMTRGTFNMQHQFDIVGSSFRNEALRFGEQGANARRVEMSSYLMQFQHGTRKLSVGHSSFGTQRHLINSFASRGFTAAVPISEHLDVSLAAMNSTNIVGFDNFFGLANSRHRLYGGVVGLEVFSKRPGSLRFETGAVDAWFLADRQNFTQGNINDSERSKGASFRLLAKDKTERARFDGGFTRSQFFNPEDPLLNQDAANVVQSQVTTRNARYAEGSIDLLKELSFVKAKPTATQPANGEAVAQQQTTDAQAIALPDPKKLNLTLNVKHERVDPLFRSIGAAAQPDLNQNIIEFVGSFGELSFTASHTRFNDNLAGIQTILRTNTRRDTFAINTPTQNLFKLRPAAVPNILLPRIGYTFERTRANADFIPIGGGFDQPGAIPDQANINQSITAEWQLTEKYRASYRLNHTLQDNRAIGREIADLQNFVHTASFGFTPMPTLELSFDLNFEDANNRELANTNRTLRLGFIANWQATTRQSVNVTFATLGAGDLLRTTNSRNDEFDAQWTYRLTRESENKFKKVQMIYFIRYSNRFARTNNFVERINNLTKLNTFNTGLNFIIF
ncbi:MAG: hypothetical protein SF097_23435 [Acidobacteriota bacterium]|nr:hypothetical protein [Acidobacteriota bacterium]